MTFHSHRPERNPHPSLLALLPSPPEESHSLVAGHAQESGGLLENHPGHMLGCHPCGDAWDSEAGCWLRHRQEAEQEQKKEAYSLQV